MTVRKRGQQHRAQGTRGRAGGRAGGAGYDYQDTYVAWQLAKLLVAGREKVEEVLWEKKAIDWGNGCEAHRTFVDDVVLRISTGKRVHVQVKEAAPGGAWSIAELARSGVLLQFWREWSSQAPEARPATLLRLASCGDVSPLNILIDVARRSRTPSELQSDEASEDVADDLTRVTQSLVPAATAADVLSFLRSVEAEQLPQAQELEAWITRTLAAAGPRAVELTDRLVRLVARSKHAGPAAASFHTRESLVAALRQDGVDEDTLIGIGAVRAKPLADRELWDRYRARIVEDFRSFRVYGLQVERAVYADLPALFVPLAFVPADPDRRPPPRPDARRGNRSLTERLLDVDFGDEGPDRGPKREEALDLARILSEKRRLAIIGGPGSGKTTTLKWLAITAASPGEEASRQRIRLGLAGVAAIVITPPLGRPCAAAAA